MDARIFLELTAAAIVGLYTLFCAGWLVTEACRRASKPRAARRAQRALNARRRQAVGDTLIDEIAAAWGSPAGPSRPRRVIPFPPGAK